MGQLGETRMALFQSTLDGRFVSPGARLLIGRGLEASWRVDDPTVSLEHAAVYFGRGAWFARDLASRNGSRINDQTLTPRMSHRLTVGDELGFASASERLRVLDVRPPSPSASTSNGNRVFGVERTLWLPDSDAPLAVVNVVDSQWILETVTEQRSVRNGDQILVGRRAFRLELPPPESEVLPTTHAPVRQSPLGLCFRVSRDQESVGLQVQYLGVVVELGIRAHNYPLLLLAEARLKDLPRIAPEAGGWVGVDDLIRWLKLDRESLNLQLWRAKESFKRLRLPADDLIDRRVETRQLRLGPSTIEIARD